MKWIDADKLIAEIERLVGAHTSKRGQDEVAMNLNYLKEFVTSLQQEQPSLPSNLDEAANKFAVLYDQGTCDGIAQDCFKAGAKWQKAQMMKDAVEADVNTYKDLLVGKSWAEFVVEMPTSNLGDKVRLIVLPMEE